MKREIVVFSTSYTPFVGGAEVAIQEVAYRLRDRFDFVIVTSRFRRDLPKREIRPEGTIIRLGFGTRFDKWLLPVLGAVYAVWKLKIENWKLPKRIVALWGMDISQGALAAAFAKLVMPRLPFLLSIQYGESEHRLRRGRLGAIGAAFRFMLRQADFLAPESTYLFNLARQYGHRGPAEVIPNGADIEKFKAKSAKRKTNGFIIITIGRLVHKNGIDILIRAIAEAKKTIPDVQCYIIGDGPERKNLELQATSYKLQAHVRFFGNVSHDELPKHLATADVFVRPSRSEGMGNVFVEALAAGLPIIGTPVGGIPDIIEDGKTGLFTKPEDSYDCAEKIVHLLKDPALALRIAQEGGRMVRERFSWDRIAVSYGQLFNRYRGETSIVETVEVSPLTIAIATPLWPPALGGPAQYAANLAREFEAKGHHVSVLSYGKDISLQIPTGFRHAVFFMKFFSRAWKSDVVFSLDQFSVGFPVALAALLLRRPHVTRVAGDFLWESFVERTRVDVTLSEFYRLSPHLSWKERIIKRVVGWVLYQADMLVFSSEWRRDMARRAYGISGECTAIVKNVWPPPIVLQAISHKLQARVIFWAGRMLYLKNLYRLIRAFARASDGTWELHLVGEGPERAQLERFVQNKKITGVKFFPPMPHEKLLEKYREAAFFALPSLSDVGPNVIADAVSCGTPFLMTRESGYAEVVKDYGLLVDPLDEADIEKKLRMLMDEKTRESYRRKLSEWKFERSWQGAAEEWIAVCKRIFYY